MAEYIRRTEFLKGVIDTQKLTNPIERVVAAQMLPKTLSSLPNSTGSNIVTQIHQKTAAKYNRELRSELFNSNTGINCNLTQSMNYLNDNK